jgi:hypothetical protein
MPSQQPTSRTRSRWLLLPLAALLTILPLLLHGPSCGHDQGFHLVSWLDAAAQLRHGHYPRWAISPAWNAGEPRFLFYPPLSWLLGALLTLTLPATAAPIAYIFLSLTASGLTMYRLAREFAAPHAALLASAFYLANPYMLFNAFERSAFAELLAAAWIPLLMLAVLRTRPTVRGIAIPLALLWLTNAPAAVMGSYLLALLATVRVMQAIRRRNSLKPSLLPTPYSLLPGSLSLTYLTGTVLGLALPAFYLLPAAIQRRNIQIEMAIIPNMRFQDNFLFDNTADAGHNGVNHAISLLAVAVLAATVLAVTTLLLQRRAESNSNPGAPFMRGTWRMSGIATALTLLTALIALLLFPVSTPLWNHVPELAFLQFPWRLLTILSAVLALTLALILNRILTKPGAPHLDSEMWAGAQTPGAPSIRGFMRMGGVATTLLALLLPTTLTFLLYAHTAQGCELRDLPTSIASSLATGHGVSPTDEYTPNNADNDLLRTSNPGFWLAPSPTDPAPNTVPTPTELNPAANTDDFAVPFNQTLSTPAPHHIQLHTDRPGYLILNLRDYPNWDITESDTNAMSLYHPPHNHRDDGLVALTLYYGSDYTIDIHWHRTWDQNLGLFITCLALLALTLAFFVARSRAQPS